MQVRLMPFYTIRSVGTYLVWATPLAGTDEPVSISTFYPSGRNANTPFWGHDFPQMFDMPGGEVPGVPVTRDMLFKVPPGTVVRTDQDEARLIIAQAGDGVVVYDSAHTAPAEPTVPEDTPPTRPTVPEPRPSTETAS